MECSVSQSSGTGRHGGAGSTVPRRRLGAELRRWRRKAELTQAEAAEVLDSSASRITRLEGGRISIKRHEVDLLCRHYGMPEEIIKALVGLAAETNSKGWYHAFGDLIPVNFDVYIGLEGLASELRSYESELVPGLLQTEDYAEAIMRADGSTPEGDLARRITLRMKRQELLNRPVPIRAEFILNEAVLRRPVGGRRVMAGQLRKINHIGELPNVKVRVLPFSAGLHLGLMAASFVLLDFADEDDIPIVYIDGFAGDLYLDKPHENKRYRYAWANLELTAADEDASREMITQAAEELEAS